MQRPASPAPDAPPPGPIVPLALAVYLPMLAIGLLATPPGAFRVADPQRLGWGLLAALGVGAAVVVFSRWSARHTAWGRALHVELQALLAGLTPTQILLLALLSALGEEFLFRGVLHPRLGLWPTALLFTLLHFPLRRSLRPWTAFAFVLGVVLGLLTDFSASLWPAVVLHFGINQLNLHDLARPPAAPRPPPK